LLVGQERAVPRHLGGEEEREGEEEEKEPSELD
jgi:hypothetical protein